MLEFRTNPARALNTSTVQRLTQSKSQQSRTTYTQVTRPFVRFHCTLLERFTKKMVKNTDFSFFFPFIGVNLHRHIEFCVPLCDRRGTMCCSATASCHANDATAQHTPTFNCSLINATNIPCLRRSGMFFVKQVNIHGLPAFSVQAPGVPPKYPKPATRPVHFMNGISPHSPMKSLQKQTQQAHKDDLTAYLSLHFSVFRFFVVTLHPKFAANPFPLAGQKPPGQYRQ